MIDLICEDDRWLTAVEDVEGLAAKCFDAALARESALRGEVALLLTNDQQMQALNKQFRGKDNPTNVLSFPCIDGLTGVHANDTNFLGDIAIGIEVCRQEAAALSISLRDHAAHLMVHGMLHLVGYDHVEHTDAAAMEGLEAEILQTLGIENPYDRAKESGN